MARDLGNQLVARNLLMLPRLLRHAGVHVNAERARLYLQAIAEIDLERPEDMRAASRTALVSRQADLAAFEATFDLFWALLRGASLPRVDSGVRVHGRAADDVEVPLAPIPSRMAPLVQRTVRVVASPVELLRAIDFAAMTTEERNAAARFLERLQWSPGQRPSRRFRAARYGPRLDARATLRKSLSAHGEPAVLIRRAPRPKRRPLVILCDVSGSMESYTRLLLHMSHALARGWGRVETFTFGTRLTRITRQLRERSPDAALARVSRAVVDWSGGTRIGDALREFNVRWSRRVLGRGAIVLLVTDGWERGDPARLEQEAARLQRAAYRLIWVDPLSGTRDYSPDARGARALTGHVDDHLAANTLDGLARVAELLGQAGHGRPVRRAEVAA
ncbi:MAG TPA: VWA domain-containing protein [Candidatus Limnocylindria bacterium]|nr:VWA domain-containing protein [Candidatus Limnocylindria bacterium]